MLMKDDIDNLTVLAALSRKDIFKKPRATSLLADLRETLRLSSDQVEKQKPSSQHCFGFRCGNEFLKCKVG